MGCSPKVDEAASNKENPAAMKPGEKLPVALDRRKRLPNLLHLTIPMGNSLCWQSGKPAQGERTGPECN